MTYDMNKARKAVRDPRWSKKCTLMGCTSPMSEHDHHMSRGHLQIAACNCVAQSGEPGFFGEDK